MSARIIALGFASIFTAMGCGGDVGLTGESNGAGGLARASGGVTSGDTSRGIGGSTNVGGSPSALGGSAQSSGGVAALGGSVQSSGGAAALGGFAGLGGSALALSGASAGGVHSLGGATAALDAGSLGGSSAVRGDTSFRIPDDGLLDPGPIYPGSLKVSQDERHVAFITDVIAETVLQSQCPEMASEWLTARTQGVGTLRVATISNDGTVTSRVVGQQVRYVDYAFSADSLSLVYEDNYQPCPFTSRLNIAGADGTGARVVIPEATDQTISLVNNTLFYSNIGTTDTVYHALQLPNGLATTVPRLPGSGNFYPSPDGTRLAYCSSGNALTIEDLNTGSGTSIANSGNLCDRVIWSPSGEWLVFQSNQTGRGYTITAATRAGASPIQLETAGLLIAPSWSHDGNRLLYDAPDGHGGTQLVLHSFVGEKDVSLAGGPSPTVADGWVEFSEDDSAVLLKYANNLIADAGPDAISLLVARASASDSLHFISEEVQYALSPDGNFVAVNDGNGGDRVFTTLGNVAAEMPLGEPQYEPTVTSPRLLLVPSDVPAPTHLYLRSTEGTEISSIAVPNGASFVQWLGHSVVFATTDTDGNFVYLAVIGSGPNSTTLAVSPTDFTHASVTSPTRVFYTRRTGSSAFPAGLFTTPLP